MDGIQSGVSLKEDSEGFLRFFVHFQTSSCGCLDSLEEFLTVFELRSGDGVQFFEAIAS